MLKNYNQTKNLIFLCGVIILFTTGYAQQPSQDSSSNMQIAVKKYQYMYSFHVGSAHPLDDLDSLADANINFQFDFSYVLNDRFNIKLMLGINQFTAESSTGIDHPLWINASANVQALFPTSTGLINYLQLGPGWYKSKSGSDDFGFNLGAGGQIPLPGIFHLVYGLDFHQIQTKDPTRFITAHLGVFFR